MDASHIRHEWVFMHMQVSLTSCVSVISGKVERLADAEPVSAPHGFVSCVKQCREQRGSSNITSGKGARKKDGRAKAALQRVSRVTGVVSDHSMYSLHVMHRIPLHRALLWRALVRRMLSVMYQKSFAYDQALVVHAVVAMLQFRKVALQI